MPGRKQPVRLDGRHLEECRWLRTFGFIAVTFMWVTCSHAQPTRPNLLLIMADDVGVECLGCYGGTTFPTPNIDQLAENGLRFEHAYSMAVCHPTRIALLTGRYPFRFGAAWGTFPNETAPSTLGSVLQDAGYATAVAGKWQLTMLRDHPEHPHQLGFDEYCLFGWHEGPRYWNPLIWQNGSVRDDVEDQYGPDVYVDFLIDFMDRHREQPFFAYYPMALCHDVTDDLAEPVPFGPGKNRYDSYAEMMEQMDRMVGRLVGALDDMGLREETLILFTTDNGTPSRAIAGVRRGELYREPIPVQPRNGNPRYGAKGTLLDGGTHVPLIANQPGTVSPGRSSDMVDFTDFLVTLSDLAHAPRPSDVAYDGHSFATRILGQPGVPRRWAFAEHRGRAFVRTQDWKLYGDGQLFHMAADPGEQHPLDRDVLDEDAVRARNRLTAVFEAIGWD